MLKLVLFTIIMTTFLTGCGENNKFKAADGLTTDTNKVTLDRPKVDHDALVKPKSVNFKTLDQALAEAEQARIDKEKVLSDYEKAEKEAGELRAELEKMEAQREAILSQGQSGINEAMENGLKAGEQERDKLLAQIAEAETRAQEAKERENEAELKTNQIALEQATLNEKINILENELAGLRAEETQTSDSSESEALKAQITELKKQLTDAKSLETDTSVNKKTTTTDTNTPPPSVISTTLDQTNITSPVPTRPEEANSDQLPTVEETTNKASIPPSPEQIKAMKDKEMALEEVKRNFFADYNRYVVTAKKESNTTTTVSGTDSTTEDQVSTMLNLATIFTKTDDKKPMFLTFSGVESSKTDLIEILNKTFRGVMESDTALNSKFSLLVSDCNNNENFSDFSGWLLPKVNQNNEDQTADCTFKALDKSSIDKSFGFVSIPEGEQDSFNIENILDVVNPRNVLFLADLETSDIKNYQALDPAFSKYRNFTNLISKINSKSRDINGNPVPVMNIIDENCNIMVLSKTLNEEDLNEHSTKRCPVTVQRIDD